MMGIHNTRQEKLIFISLLGLSVEITFECLGHWQVGNRKYLALMNSRNGEKLGPQYRCAVSKNIEINSQLFQLLRSYSSLHSSPSLVSDIQGRKRNHYNFLQ